MLLALLLLFGDPPVIERSTLDVAGHPVAIRRSGDAKGSALPVLLLHGARFHSGTWEELGTLATLAEAGIPAIAVDLPGYGASPALKAGEQLGLAAILDALELPRAIVVFPSMSGSTAFPLLTAHPERLAGAVPIAPVGADGFQPTEKSAAVPALIVWGEQDTLFPVAGAARLAALFDEAEVLVLEGAAHPAYLDRPEEFHRGLLAFARRLQPAASTKPPKQVPKELPKEDGDAEQDGP